MKLFFKNLKQYQLKTIPKLIILSLAVVITAFMYACDKGTDSVDFEHYLDANDRRVVHFNAKGKSDYGDFKYQWQFGDGSVGTGKEITHEFGDFGKFTVILTATIEKSNIETSIVKEIEVVIPKITGLDFEVTPDKKNPRLYNFRAVSNIDYGNIEYDWDFGDGMTASGDNVQYGFEYFGDYEVSLKATISEYEKVSSVSKQFVKVAAPSITRLDIYAVQDDYNPFLYHFKPIAESSWGTLAYEWSFGDGKYAYDEEVQNIYSNYASYAVKVKATIKETGTVKELVKIIEVEQPIFKHYEITYTVDPNDPLKVYFTIENKDGESEDMSQQDSFRWEFSDGNTASGLRVNYRYESYGEKTVYVTLRTAQQTQKTLTKTFTLETPAIKNIKPSGRPSYKAGNIVQYNVVADSEFEDEIEYKWEFNDGTIKSGRIVERDMSYWADIEAGTPGQIKEEVYVTASIPRLNVKVRNLYEIYVIKPSIKNVGINCVNNGYVTHEFICSPNDNGTFPTIAGGGGGKIEYEWVFNGQSYNGANQRFEVDGLAEYPLTLIATIENTNITKQDRISLKTVGKEPYINCYTQPVEDTAENALLTTCTPTYDTNFYTNVRIKWDFGDGSQPYNTLDREKQTHRYKKAGVYPVKITFLSTQSGNEKMYAEIEALAMVKPVASGRIWKSSYQTGGANKCGNTYYYFYRGYFDNNFHLFNQDDFTITNEFNASGSCECQGVKGTDNVWYSNGKEIQGGCWGNYNSQTIKTTICKKGTTNIDYECVSNFDN